MGLSEPSKIRPRTVMVIHANLCTPQLTPLPPTSEASGTSGRKTRGCGARFSLYSEGGRPSYDRTDARDLRVLGCTQDPDAKSGQARSRWSIQVDGPREGPAPANMAMGLMCDPLMAWTNGGVCRFLFLCRYVQDIDSTAVRGNIGPVNIGLSELWKACRPGPPLHVRFAGAGNVNVGLSDATTAEAPVTILAEAGSQQQTVRMARNNRTPVKRPAHPFRASRRGEWTPQPTVTARQGKKNV